MFYLLIVLLLNVSCRATTGTSPFKYVTFRDLNHITVDSTLTATIKYGLANSSHLNSNYYFNASLSYSYTDLTKNKTSSIQTNVNQKIQIIFSEVITNFSILLYCAGWPSGTYTFSNFALIQSQHSNNAGKITNSNGKSILAISSGKKFSGILEFPLYAHVQTLQWTGPAQEGKKLIFGAGILYPVTCTAPKVDKSLVKGTCTGKYHSQCSYTCGPGYKPATYVSDHCMNNGTYQFTLQNKLPSTCIPTSTPSPTATCSDSKQNGDETGVDCGGSCHYCVSCGTSGVAGICGNGIINYGEYCDDGNLVNGDGCTSQCYAGLTAFSEVNYHCYTGGIAHFDSPATQILRSHHVASSTTIHDLRAECDADDSCNGFSFDSCTDNTVTFFAHYGGENSGPETSYWCSK